MTSLVIVESPAKCKKIEAILGAKYKVIASFGHLRALDGLSSIDIDNNFNPTFTQLKTDMKIKQIKIIQDAISKSSEVIIASDNDREGEAIGWHICDMFDLSVERTKRIIFNEITDNAITTAINSPTILNMNLIYAQRARQILDLLVGYTISPVLWNNISKTHNTSLSAGRCQSPALRLIYDNYKDIVNSQGTQLYNTSGIFTDLNLVFELNKQFSDKESVVNFLNKSKSYNSQYDVSPPKKSFKKNPEPLTTSTLQQFVSNELSLSPKDTMSHAQKLYEAGLITYMRTDSKKYSKGFITNIEKYITYHYGSEYISGNISNLTNAITGLTQEAHEAIRPTDINITSSPLLLAHTPKLTPRDMKIYELIRNRTLESCMPSAQYNSITATISAPLSLKFTYKAEHPIFIGWKVVTNKKSESTNQIYSYLQTLKVSQQVTAKKINSVFALSELKSHYSEARLVQLLEENGIGRPSTFATLIDKIKERKYVEKQNIKGQELECIDLSMSNGNISEIKNVRTFGNEKNKLVILPVGIIVIEFLIANFNGFFSYNYTEAMEHKLDMIAKNNKLWSSLCSECYDELTKNVSLIKSDKFSLTIDDTHALMIGKFGPVIKCVDKNNNKISFLAAKKDLDMDKLRLLVSISLEDVLDEPVESRSVILGKYKGQDLFVKKGKYGLYVQWLDNRHSLNSDEFDSNSALTDIDYLQVIQYLDKDTILDSSKPVGLIRELTKTLSIRSGKYGDYILYKKPRAIKPQFLKLDKFKENYNTCSKQIILQWVKNVYNIG